MKTTSLLVILLSLSLLFSEGALADSVKCTVSYKDAQHAVELLETARGTNNYQDVSVAIGILCDTPRSLQARVVSAMSDILSESVAGKRCTKASCEGDFVLRAMASRLALVRDSSRKSLPVLERCLHDADVDPLLREACGRAYGALRAHTASPPSLWKEKLSVLDRELAAVVMAEYEQIRSRSESSNVSHATVSKRTPKATYIDPKTNKPVEFQLENGNWKRKDSS